MTMKRIAILGSTGSIGVSALEVVRGLPGDFSVVGLAARGNAKLLAGQAREFGARMVSLFEPAAATDLRALLNGRVRHLPPGVEGLVAMASSPDVDLVLTSLVGGVGFAPLLAAVKAGKTVALANKEPMVMAGRQFMREARRWEATILPVDSEPSAIFQLLHGRPAAFRADIRRILLTASGGPFYRRRGSLKNVSVAEALAHPTWKMGRKITIDSATLMNKGFEAIEIQNLFDLGPKQVEVVIHPQSIIHSAVEYADGSIVAQMSRPDMRLPIQYALTYPARLPSPVLPLGFSDLQLTFAKPAARRFPCLGLALDAARRGGGWPAVLNAADEVAVESFLEGAIAFTGIPRLIERTMGRWRGGGREPSFADVAEIDQWARCRARELARGL